MLRHTEQPPIWLENWRKVVLRVMLLEFNVLKSMSRLVRLKIRPRAWLTASEEVDRIMTQQNQSASKVKSFPTESCTHPNCRRYGNIHGSFAECRRCLQKFKWNPDFQGWKIHGDPKLQRSSQLPAPSSLTIIPPGINRTTTPKVKAKGKSRQGPMTSSQARPSSVEEIQDPWTAAGMTYGEWYEIMSSQAEDVAFDSDNPDGYPQDGCPW